MTTGDLKYHPAAICIRESTTRFELPEFGKLRSGRLTGHRIATLLVVLHRFGG